MRLPYNARMKCLRVLAFVSALALAGACLGQGWQARGSIKSGDTQVEHRSGNTVEGTEFVHYEYRVSTSLVPTEDTKKKYTVKHDNVCKGGKHKEHAECDMSCCKKDNQTKKITIRGESEDLTANMRRMEAESAKMAAGLTPDGNPGGWDSETSSYLQQAKQDCNNQTLDVSVAPHDMPCTLRTRKYGLKKTEIHVKGEFWKVGFYMSKGVKTPIEEMVSSHEGTVVNLWYPTSDVLEETTLVTCRCKVKPKDQLVTATDGHVTVGGGTEITDGPVDGGCTWGLPGGGFCTPDPGQVEIFCTGDTLTKCEIEVVNHCGTDLICTIPVGCELAPDDSGTQIMTCTESCQMTCTAGSTTVFYVSMRPEPWFSAKATMRVACTEMMKHEPSDKTKFKLTGPQDPVLVAILSQPPSTSFFANAVMQGRVWIYKDHAGLDEINKRMLPGLSEGMYLNALYEVSRGGVDVTTAEYKKCLSPALLHGNATDDASTWYVRVMEKVSPKAFGSLAGFYSDMGDKATAADGHHMAILALAMSQSSLKDVRGAAADLIAKVPPGLLKDFLADGGASALRNLMLSADSGEAMRGVALAKTLGAKAVLQSAALWGNSADVRAAAGDAAKGMGQ